MENKFKKGDEARIVWDDKRLSGARRFKNGEIVVIDNVNNEDGYMFCLTKSEESSGHWVSASELELVTKDENAEKQMHAGCKQRINASRIFEEVNKQFPVSDMINNWKFCHSRSSKSDAVQNPQHYTLGEIECIDAIKASMTQEEFKGFLKGNIQKYMWRYEKKQNPVQDLEKARWYLSKLIEDESK